MPIGVGETPDCLPDRVNLAEIACMPVSVGTTSEMLAESSPTRSASYTELGPRARDRNDRGQTLAGLVSIKSIGYV